jgi:lipopolysaccharide transport system ATP-binding protein
MSDDVVIKVEGLGKRYQIRHQAEGRRYVALRDVLAQKLAAPFKFLRRSQKSEGRSQTSDLRPPTSARASHEDFWALKDVSFSVRQGEVVGIIGRNGAGKSTLLKILSRITEPTEGRVEIDGRVASLLEVGTGFHPELTGRENIFLNGAILGMHRGEIKKKFDEIVAFAEVEKFLDTPVKRYSSGMYVRLAFAVAAHLEPEILIVDEVLAVGDAEFQKKCLGKMQDVAVKEGRTVLFVSHNLEAVARLCVRGLVIERGRLAADGRSDEAIRHYTHSAPLDRGGDLIYRTDRSGAGQLRFRKVTLSTGSSETEIRGICVGSPLHVRFDYSSSLAPGNYSVDLAFNIKTLEGTIICHFGTKTTAQERMPLSSEGAFQCRIPALNLVPGTYRSNLYCEVNGEIQDWIQDAFEIEVVASDFFGSGRMPPARQGVVLFSHSWSNSFSPAHDETI